LYAVSYFIRYTNANGERRTTPPVTLEQAEIDLRNRQTADRRVLVPETTPIIKGNSNELPLAVAVADFLADYERDVRDSKKSPATLEVYRRAVESFRDSCG
jgi:hypothetical protein